MAATFIRLPITLPFASSSYTAPPIEKLAPQTKRRLAPAGPAFQEHAARILNKRTLDEHAAHVAAKAAAQDANGNVGNGEEEPEDDVGDEPESKALLASDPREWKNQDQYAVLGLSALRYKATQDQIKRAHRKKVLRHHPDKKAGQAGNANDDSFFKCIAKAYEVLSDPVKRRQFDSVDEGVDESAIPSSSQVTIAADFCRLYAPVFEREARFSNKTPVPLLGDENSSREEIEAFYDFWLKFDSWRSFEWKDKDANEGSDSRNEKRHIENKNRSERERRKKEDNARRRNVVETAVALDPRMKAFKASERAARDAKKKGATGTASGASTPSPSDAAAKAKAEAEAKAAADAQAASDKAAKEVAKKAKEAAKKNLKREKKAISSLVTLFNYFLPEGDIAGPSVIEGQLSEVDLIIGGLEPEEVGEMRKEMEVTKEKGREEVRAVVVAWAKKVAQAGKGSFKEFA